MMMMCHRLYNHAKPDFATLPITHSQRDTLRKAVANDLPDTQDFHYDIEKFYFFRQRAGVKIILTPFWSGDFGQAHYWIDEGGFLIQCTIYPYEPELPIDDDEDEDE